MSENTQTIEQRREQYRKRQIDLYRKSTQLVALLTVAAGEDFPHFKEDTQSSFLWACLDLAKDIRKLT